MKDIFNDDYINQIKLIIDTNGENLSNDFKDSLNLNSKNKIENKLSDFQLENMVELIFSKTETIVNYFSSLLGLKLSGNEVRRIINENEIKETENFKYFFPYLKEMSIFTLLTHFEIQLLMEFLKGEIEDDDNELSLVKITPNNYDYTFIDLSGKRLEINRENPKVEDYIKQADCFCEHIYFIVGTILGFMEKKIEDIDIFEYLQESMKTFAEPSTEKYFFALFDKGIDYHTKKEFTQAYKVLIISKYYYENLVFIRMISHNKQPTANFFDLVEYFEFDDFINLEENSKLSSKQITAPSNDCLLFTFLCGIYKTFKKDKIIDEDLMTQSTIGYSKDALDCLISFFPELLKLIIECSK